MTPWYFCQGACMLAGSKTVDFRVISQSEVTSVSSACCTSGVISSSASKEIFVTVIGSFLSSASVNSLIRFVGTVVFWSTSIGDV